MAAYNRNGWLNTAMDQVRSKPEHKAIRAELLGHIEDKEQYFLDKGMEQRDAAKAAVEAMGDPVEVGKELDKAHPVWWAKLYTVCKVVIALLCIVAAFFAIDMAVAGTYDDILQNYPLKIYSYDPAEWGSEGVIIWEDPYEAVKQSGYTIDVTRAYWNPVVEYNNAYGLQQDENVLEIDVKVFNPRPWAEVPLFMYRLELLEDNDIDFQVDVDLASGGQVTGLDKDSFDHLKEHRYWGAWYFTLELVGVEHGETVTVHLPGSDQVKWTFQVGVSE